jgi:CheY-like chemotaxis protein
MSGEFSQDSTRVVLALVSDLLFATRIREAAARADACVEFVTQATDLVVQLSTRRVRLVLIDLFTPPFDPMEAVRVIKTECGDRVRVVAFGSHVDDETLTRARAAGADRVLPRSKFVATLPEILKGAL